ncbi:helix-turn-helix domain-containing protein [Halomonas ramblicola]|nr:helix-turn-helix domain-containing protein [Halomonas ramblicola]MDN3523521.1 helix-turn-helix domain-containing protein [Halomonas ramblicola]
MVLSALRRRPMSAAELQWELPIADARAVVRDLIAKGYRIEKHDHPNPDLTARCRKIRRYHLVESK